MKFHTMLLGTALLLGACDKANDVPRLQDEVTATAKEYRKRYDALAERLQAIGKRGDALGKSAETGGEAYKEFHDAKSIVDEAKRRLDTVPQAEQTAAKTGNAEELQKLLDTMSQSLEDGLTEATAKANAAEAWIALAEQHAGEPATEPATPPPPSSEAPPTETPSTTGTGPQPGTAGSEVPSGTANPPTTGAPSRTGSNTPH